MTPDCAPEIALFGEAMLALRAYIEECLPTMRNNMELSDAYATTGHSRVNLVVYPYSLAVTLWHDDATITVGSTYSTVKTDAGIAAWATVSLADPLAFEKVVAAIRLWDEYDDS